MRRGFKNIDVATVALESALRFGAEIVKALIAVTHDAKVWPSAKGVDFESYQGQADKNFRTAR